jgi:hypothetical protein
MFADVPLRESFEATWFHFADIAAINCDINYDIRICSCTQRPD